MLRGIGRVLLGVVTTLLVLVAVAATAVFVLSNTDWGRERVRRFALAQLQGRVHGQVAIGRISGNLLTGMTLHDIAIRDSTGAPFLAAESLTASYTLRGFFSRRLWFDDVKVVRPVVVLDRPPNGTWNYKRIFYSDTTTKGPATGPSWTSHIQFTDVTIVDGQLIARTPWHPSERLRPAAQDSAVREALSGGSRLMVVQVPGGYQKIVELRELNAQAPLLRLTDPAFPDRLARVSSLRMVALPFRPPAATVRDMRGDFHFNDDSLWWTHVYAELPASRISGDGNYQLDSGDLTLDLRGAPAATADLRWVYPRLPSEGSGTLDFVMQWKGATDTYIARNADIRSGGARIQGDFGFTKTDTFTIHDTDLRLTNVSTRLVEQLVPHFDSPRNGTLSGRVQMNGGQHSMFVNADVAFADTRAGTSRVAAVGTLGFVPGVSARDLRLRLDPLQVELARDYLKSAPLSGIVTGTAVVNGNTRTQLAVSGNLRHVDRGAVSAVDGRATVRLAGGMWVDADVTARPLSLVEIGRFAPSLGLQGWVSGPIRLTGSPRNLQLRTNLRLPDGGVLEANGRLALSGARKSYDISTAMRVVNLHTVVSKAPATSLTLLASARGSGTSLATLNGAFSANLAASSWDSVSVDSGTVRVAIDNGLAKVERLKVSGAHTLIEASGTFGLAAGRQGELSYRVAVDSLGALERWLPRSASDTGLVTPRPGRLARALRVARADSTRVARQTEVERSISGAPPPRLVVDTPKAVPRDRLSGSVYLAGVARGNIRTFDLRGRATGDSVVAFGNSLRRFKSEYAWTNARTPQSTVALGLQADSVSTAGFAFDSIDARIGYTSPNGRVEVVVRQGDERDYGLKGDFILDKDHRQLRIADMSLRFDTTRWAATHPATVDWRAAGVQVSDLELRNGQNGRIYISGLLPTEGSANFDLQVDNFEVANLTDLLQSDLELTGLVSLHGRLTGTLRNPTFSGAFGVNNGLYRNTTLPELHGTFAYANQRLTTRVDAVRNGGQPMAVVSGQLPINLALQGVTGSRMLKTPMTFSLDADSLPLELVPYFTDAVSNVSGLAAGRIVMTGTLDHPVLVGGLVLAQGGVTITKTGMRVTDVAASIRMLNDSVLVDSIVGRSRGPIRVAGSIGIGSWRTPTFDLLVTASGAEVLRNDWGRLRADMGLSLRGPFNRAFLTGQATITQGVVYAPEATGKKVINAGDPALFAVVDTSNAIERELFPTGSPLLDNLRVDISLAVQRNTWVRSTDMNIEMFTEYPISIRSRSGNIALTGTIATDRGEYSFLSKRFQISRGSATFIGGPDLNPTIQVSGDYQVQVAAAPPLTIKVLVAGTLRRPRVSLESDAQPPRSQSELLTLLAFGRSTSNTLQGGSSNVASGIAPGELVGMGAQLAVRQLAGIAVGVAMQELETEAGRGLGADVFDISPASVPQQLGSPQGIGQFIQGTRVEVGKYVNPRTFVGLQEEAYVLGARVQHRTPKGWLYSAYWEPRTMLKEPTLAGQAIKSTTALGAFVLREWRF